MFISLQWHLSVGGIFHSASKHLVVDGDVLEAGKLCKLTDLTDSDKVQNVMTRQQGQSVSKTCHLVLLGVRSG